MTWRGKVQGGVVIPEKGVSLPEGSDVLIEAFPAAPDENEQAFAELKSKLERGSANADNGQLLTPDEVLGRIAKLRHGNRGKTP